MLNLLIEVVFSLSFTSQFVRIGMSHAWQEAERQDDGRSTSDARVGYRLTEYSSGAVPVFSAGVDLVGSATRGDREYPYRCSASSPAWPGWLAVVIGVVGRGATFVLASDGERGFLGGCTPDAAVIIPP